MSHMIAPLRINKRKVFQTPIKNVSVWPIKCIKYYIIYNHVFGFFTGTCSLGQKYLYGRLSYIYLSWVSKLFASIYKLKMLDVLNDSNHVLSRQLAFQWILIVLQFLPTWVTLYASIRMKNFSFRYADDYYNEQVDDCLDSLSQLVWD
jgi:hypothetical protein